MDQRARQLTRTRRRALRSAVALAGGLVLQTVLTAPVAAQDAVSVSDTESTRAILLVVAGLVVMGLLLTAVTVWFWRSTRPDHPVLAPLEVMGDRGFVAKSAFEQRQVLDSVRPEGAEVLRAVPVDDALTDRGGAALDLQRLVVETPTSFDDLIEPAPPVPDPVESSGPAEQVAALPVEEPTVEEPTVDASPVDAPPLDASPVEEPSAESPLAPEVPVQAVSDPLRIVEPSIAESSVDAPPVEAPVGSSSEMPPPPPVPADR